MKILKQRINIILHKRHINMIKRLAVYYRHDSRSSIIRELIEEKWRDTMSEKK